MATSSRVQASSTPASAGRSAPDPGEASPTTLRSYRRAGVAGIVSLVAWIAGTLLAGKPDLTTQGAVRSFLDDSGPRLFVSWLVMSVFAIAWLVFVLGVKAVVKAGPATDLFTAAAVLGQALLWTGAGLDTAAAGPGAHQLSLSSFNALDEASHLTIAAGITATGLALVSLACTTASPVWPKGFVRGTLLAGIVLVLTGVVGPLSIPVLAMWTTAASVLLLLVARSLGTVIEPSRSDAGNASC